MKFAIPQMLWLLAAAVPALALFLAWAHRKRTALALQFVQARLLPQLTLGRTASRTRLRTALQTVAVGLLFLALARPQWGFTWDEARQRGLDILVAIDTSRSMLATDLAPNRLTRSKLAALDLLKLAKTDRLGLIAFAGTAFLQCPLTLDDFAFRESVNALNVGIIPHGGSALAEAIDTALAALEGDPENHRILVVFSDGEDHEDTALAAAEKAAKAGLKIFTIGVGTAAGELVRQSDAQGGSDWVRDADGNAVKSRLNETLLQQIATAAQGFYIPLRGANTMETLYQQGLAPLPKSELNARMIQRFHERFQWPLALAVVLLLLDSLIRDVPRPRRPRKLSAAPASSQAAALLALFLTLATPDCEASTAKAAADYQQGQFSEAQRLYEAQLKKHPDDPALAYNAGAAAYKASDLEAAARNFESAARAKDLKLQQLSLYNLGNTLYRQGESLQDPKQTSSLWERSIRSYDNALKLQPQDTDAQFNRDLVRQRLEQLKQQQQQQQQSDPQQNNQDSKDPKEDQNKSSDSSKDPQQPPQPNQGDPSKQQQDQDKANKPPESKKPSNQEQSSKPDPQSGNDDQPKQEPRPQDQAGPSQSKQDQPKPGSGDKPGEGTDPGDTQGAAPGGVAMNLQQARQLLETHRAEERAMIFTNTLPRRNPPRLLKDW